MRTERPSQVVESLSVLFRRAFTPSNASADPSIHDFTGWPPIDSLASDLNLLLLSRLRHWPLVLTTLPIEHYEKA